MDKNLHEATNSGMQSTGSFDEQMTYPQQQVFFSEEKVVESSDGLAMNGVLTQIPASTVRLESGSEIELQPELSRAQTSKRKLPNWAHSDEVVELQQQASTSNNEALPPRKKPTSFRLFRIAGCNEEYILEQTIVETGDVPRYRLSTYEVDDGSWKVKKSKAPKEALDLSMVVEDSDKPLYVKDCEVPFQERLQGWTFRTTQRSSGTTDTVYYHMRQTFRSLVEVSQFIVYSCYSKMKKVPIQRAHIAEKEPEADAVEAMMILASEPVRNVNHQDPNVNDPPVENPIVLVGNEVDLENHIRNDNLIAEPLPDDNFVAHLPEIEVLDEAVDDEDIFASLPDIEKL